MPRTPWSQEVARINRVLEPDGVLLMGVPVRLKVRHRPLEDGSRPIDAVGHFNRDTKRTTRATGVVLTQGTHEIRLQEAEERLRGRF